MFSIKIRYLFVIYSLFEVLIIVNNITLIDSKDKCISWKQLEEIFNKKNSEDSGSNQEISANNTDANADALQVDKEQIKRLPSTPDGGPVNISVTFYIDDINSISDVDMDFIIDFYYIQKWNVTGSDCHTYKNSLGMRNISWENVNQTNKLTITKEYFTLFWLPDIIISNAKNVRQQSDVIDTTLLFIFFDSNDTCRMEYMARLASKVSCPMDFHDAPIDTQICSIQLRSFAFNEDKINLEWEGIVNKSGEIKLLEHDMSVTQDKENTILLKETYSVLKINLKFDRKLANKMVGVYTPSILIVMITFCSFWLGLNSTSERVTIGITALLALVTQFNDVRHSLPPTSYITEIDKWMIMCMSFVSAQMVQCTLVDFVYHRQQHNQKLKETAKKVLEQFRRNSQLKKSQRAFGNKIAHDCFYQEKVNPYAKVIPNSNLNQLKIAFTKIQVKKQEIKKQEPNDWISWIRQQLLNLISVPTTPDKPEYLPMKIDAVSRIIFPLFLITICMFYWPTMLLKLF